MARKLSLKTTVVATLACTLLLMRQGVRSDAPSTGSTGINSQATGSAGPALQLVKANGSDQDGRQTHRPTMLFTVILRSPPPRFFINNLHLRQT